MGIYHWKLGDVALARLCKKVYAKVKVVKNEDGLFYEDMVLGISSSNNDNTEVKEELCYYVEINRTGQRMWLPYTCMHLAERGRPFYGIDKVSPPKPTTPAVPRKRKIKEDHPLPLSVKPYKQKEPDLNTTYDYRHTPLKQGRYENAFSEFVRRGKEMLFDQFYSMLENDEESDYDTLDYLRNVDASTEDKFEMVLKNMVTEKEIENYLHQCWRFNFVNRQSTQANKDKDGSDNSKSVSLSKLAVTVHTSWCLVCGQQEGRLKECPNCPAAFHLACRREWLVTIIHRKKPPQQSSKRVTLVSKILSSTRTVVSVQKDIKENTELCPSCMWGPRIGYEDVVWHKLGTCSWWPAKVLPPGATPSCLLSRSHAPRHQPLRYYVVESNARSDWNHCSLYICRLVALLQSSGWGEIASVITDIRGVPPWPSKDRQSAVYSPGTENYSWGEPSRMCLFLPSHTSVLGTARDPTLQQAVLDACDDYIAVYLK